MIITKEYLRANPSHVFVFGDNLLRAGLGGAASLRYEPNTYGFITKKAPNIKDSSFYTPEEYQPVFEAELDKLKEVIDNSPDKTFLVSKLGAGLANKYGIYEKVIRDRLPELLVYPNVRLI